MTEQEEIDRLDARVTKIEGDIWAELKTIRETLVALQINSARSGCPSPGKCLQLDTALGSAVLRIERLELRMMEIDAWRYRILGGIAVLLCALTLFGPSIRKMFNLE
jgi:hypothetical protein